MVRMAFAGLALLALAACAGTGAGGEDAKAAVRGHDYAQWRCASCHAIEPGDLNSPHVSAPAFETVANTPGMTRTALNAWLHSPHAEMPNLVVDGEDIEDLWAYMQTLKHAPES